MNSVDIEGAELMKRGQGIRKGFYKGSKPVLGFEGWIRTCQAEKVRAVFWPEETTM